MDNLTEVIHIALCICDADGLYMQHVGATVASIFENTKKTICIHLIHDQTLTEKNREFLDLLVKKYNQRIYYYSVDEVHFKEIEKLIRKSKTMTSVGMLYRLKMVDILPSLDRVIYLDGDVIVNLDINLLWSEDLGETFCGVVKDVKGTRMKWTNRFYFQRMDIDNNIYFNSGVILFNLAAIRKQMDLWNEAIGFFVKHGSKIRYCDQDALNFLLQKNAKFLSKKFNFIPVEYRYHESYAEEKAIFHFAGPKPWNCHCSPYDWLYWKYFSLTPWGDSVEKLIEAQKRLGIDLGYALQVGKVMSRRNLLNAFCPRIIAKILGQY